MSDTNARAHWVRIYSTKDESEVSWFQATPATSLALIAGNGLSLDSSIIDIGGGDSRLIDALLDAGFFNVTVLDIAEVALERAINRLGSRATSVEWVVADITRWTPRQRYDIWHDRAVFHFLTKRKDRLAYRKALFKAINPRGMAIFGTFALDGPDQCSGLPVMRYSSESLAEELDRDLQLLDSLTESHVTPGGALQRFQFSRFRRG